ncbi:MAG: polymer-forming cytoskeletal protein [Gammaproteobacteria bacterium]|nr:polymer-forming cytoskeletal protein [Gammaproteobacteria bacterium]
MFEKRSNKSEPVRQQPQQESFSASASTPVSSGRAAVIGPEIHINGDISGNEDLVVEGKVDGKIRLGANQVEIGQSGRVNANVTAKVIKIAGEVRGDLTGTEKVIISRSGNVHGNIVAPRMTLEDGAIFKGSIDMDPGEPAKAEPAAPVKKTVEKTVEKKATKAAKAVATGKVNESKGYSLN